MSWVHGVLFSAREVMQNQGMVLQIVFEAVGEALAILITLDEVFRNAEVFTEHWEQYKRFVLALDL